MEIWKFQKFCCSYSCLKITKKTFEWRQMSLHCVAYILYWMQAEWKFYIQTYCQIIWVNFTNMVAIIFFPSGHPHLADHPHPSPCLHLSTFIWPPSPLMCGHPLWMTPNENRTKIIWKLLMLFSKKSLQIETNLHRKKLKERMKKCLKIKNLF